MGSNLSQLLLLTCFELVLNLIYLVSRKKKHDSLFLKKMQELQEFAGIWVATLDGSIPDLSPRLQLVLKVIISFTHWIYHTYLYLHIGIFFYTGSFPYSRLHGNFASPPVWLFLPYWFCLSYDQSVPAREKASWSPVLFGSHPTLYKGTRGL